MVFVQERVSKGIRYIYLDKSFRKGSNVYKLSKFLGKKSEISKKRLKGEIKKFVLGIDDRVVDYLVKQLQKKIKLNYPFTVDEVRKIEEMNLKFKEIRGSLRKKDWGDVKKRFIANFVFESNALEGNSLTLKNFTEIIFENKIRGSTDLREVYDAKNSYAVFSKLFTGRKGISEELIINLHKKIMENIDERIGYKKLPHIIMGKKIKLTKPEEVKKRMNDLINWYKRNKDNLHPLELAFKFHHQFEQIHPFADGNGRVGRMLLNYILIIQGYYPLIIRKNQRNKYLKALEAADNKQYIPLMRFSIDRAKNTYRKFFEIYYKYI